MNLYRKIHTSRIKLMPGLILKASAFMLLIVFVSSCNDTGSRSCSSCASLNVKKSASSVSACKPVVNVYMENSGSMFGYVNGLTQFEESVYSYLSDIALTSTDSLNLFYINSRIIPQNNNKLSQTGKIKDFIKKLSPTHFVGQGGNLGTTDVSDMLTAILKKTDGNTVSVFISDCVFSPGRNVNANDYLVNQQIGIKAAFADKLKNQQSLSVIVYRLNAQFKGTYYNCYDKGSKIDDVRPFYMVLIGNDNLLNTIVKNVPENKIKGLGVEESAFFSNASYNTYFEITGGPKLGTFKRCMRHPKHHIYEAQRSDKGHGQGKFMFSIGVDYSNLPLSDSYLLNPVNYTLKDKDYSLTIEKNKGGSSFTHILKLTLNEKITQPTRKNLEIKLPQGFPSWIERKTDLIGEDITLDGAMAKTYGLKYLLEGIYEAYTYKGTSSYSKLNVIIN